MSQTSDDTRPTSQEEPYKELESRLEDLWEYGFNSNGDFPTEHKSRYVRVEEVLDYINRHYDPKKTDQQEGGEAKKSGICFCPAVTVKGKSTPHTHVDGQRLYSQEEVDRHYIAKEAVAALLTELQEQAEASYGEDSNFAIFTETFIAVDGKKLLNLDTNPSQENV